MGKARLLYRHRQVFDDDAILEVIIWEVPVPVVGCSHRYKYRLFYGYPGTRVVGYDNERPKGDHQHHRHSDKPYAFSSPEQLIDDFLADVATARSQS